MINQNFKIRQGDKGSVIENDWFVFSEIRDREDSRFEETKMFNSKEEAEAYTRWLIMHKTG